MSKLATKILLLKNNTNKKIDFCKTYTLDKQYKIYNKKLLINILEKPEVCLYADLFGRENILPNIWDYRYRTIVINKAMRMRFLMTMKSKNTICNKSKIFFNKIETYIDRKMQSFESDNTRKYQLLVFYFEKKVII